MSEDSSLLVYVGEWTIRQRLRETGLLEGILTSAMNNELYAVVSKDGLAPPERGQPPGTRSQIVRYFRRSDHLLMAIVHQYMKPDGTLGASGLPDPKWLRDGDRILIHDESIDEQKET